MRDLYKFHIAILKPDGEYHHHVQKNAGDGHPYMCVVRALAAASQLIRQEHVEMKIDVKHKTTGEVVYSSGIIPLGKKS